MKANELRIGNWVEFLADYENSYPVEIEPKDITEIHLEDGERPRYAPIPLNEEWLIRFGFDKLERTKLWKIGNRDTNEIYVRPYSEGGYYWGIYDRIDDHSEEIEYRSELYCGTIIKYVHQLQNLYHALTGEELTIKEKQT